MKLDKDYENVLGKKTPLQKKRDFWKKLSFVMIVLNFFAIISTIFVLQLRASADEIMDDKPIIYLYPKKETEVSVKLKYPEKITCSYPEYNDGWNVIAYPDGTLIDTKTNRTLYSLYWQGNNVVIPKTNTGFIVKGEDTIKFLEEKLEILGLNEKESEEFIIYWLPKMQNNKYNYIRFATLDEINEYMPIEFSVQPDNLIRIFMQYKAINKPFEVIPQELHTPERSGFTVVEWSGTEFK